MRPILFALLAAVLFVLGGCAMSRPLVYVTDPQGRPVVERVRELRGHVMSTEQWTQILDSRHPRGSEIEIWLEGEWQVSTSNVVLGPDGVDVRTSDRHKRGSYGVYAWRCKVGAGIFIEGIEIPVGSYAKFTSWNGGFIELGGHEGYVAGNRAVNDKVKTKYADNRGSLQYRIRITEYELQ